MMKTRVMYANEINECFFFVFFFQSLLVSPRESAEAAWVGQTTQKAGHLIIIIKTIQAANTFSLVLSRKFFILSFFFFFIVVVFFFFILLEKLILNNFFFFFSFFLSRDAAKEFVCWIIICVVIISQPRVGAEFTAQSCATRALCCTSSRCLVACCLRESWHHLNENP